MHHWLPWANSKHKHNLGRSAPSTTFSYRLIRSLLLTPRFPAPPRLARHSHPPIIPLRVPKLPITGCVDYRLLSKSLGCSLRAYLLFSFHLFTAYLMPSRFALYSFGRRYCRSRPAQSSAVDTSCLSSSQIYLRSFQVHSDRLFILRSRLYLFFLFKNVHERPVLICTLLPTYTQPSSPFLPFCPLPNIREPIDYLSFVFRLHSIVLFKRPVLDIHTHSQPSVLSFRPMPRIPEN